AFLGMLLCGYIGEKIGWHYGIGLAGVFMFFGMIQFYFGQRIFGIVGETPKAIQADHDKKMGVNKEEEETIPANIVRDRLVVVAVLMIASIVFFLAFEQAGGSMTIFAKDYTQRLLSGNMAIGFRWLDAALTIFPIMVITG